MASQGCPAWERAPPCAHTATTFPLSDPLLLRPLALLGGCIITRTGHDPFQRPSSPSIGDLGFRPLHLPPPPTSPLHLFSPFTPPCPTLQPTFPPSPAARGPGLHHTPSSPSPLPPSLCHTPTNLSPPPLQPGALDCITLQTSFQQALCSNMASVPVRRGGTVVCAGVNVPL